MAYPNSSNTQYTVTVSTAYGCTATASIVINLLCNEDAIYVPSGFTPNHDGHNDRFYPMGKGIRNINHFSVYDRWGRPVYSRDNIPINAEDYGWDGTCNGRDMPPGAYVYLLEVVCETGEVFKAHGLVTLIR
jgi:gliding motility-associated-like protein